MLVFERMMLHMYVFYGLINISNMSNMNYRCKLKVVFYYYKLVVFNIVRNKLLPISAAFRNSHLALCFYARKWS